MMDISAGKKLMIERDRASKVERNIRFLAVSIVFISIAGVCVAYISRTHQATPEEDLRRMSVDYQIRAEQAVKHNLADPGSAQFRYETVYLKEMGSVVCGQVISSKPMGGSVGYQRFIYRGDNLIWMDNAEDRSGFDEEYQDDCRD